MMESSPRDARAYTKQHTSVCMCIHTHTHTRRDQYASRPKGGPIYVCIQCLYSIHVSVEENMSAKTGADEGGDQRRAGAQRRGKNEDGRTDKRRGLVQASRVRTDCVAKRRKNTDQIEWGSSNEFFFSFLTFFFFRGEVCLFLFFFFVSISFFFLPLPYNKRSDVEGVTEKQHPLLDAFRFFFFLCSGGGPYILPQRQRPRSFFC